LKQTGIITARKRRLQRRDGGQGPGHRAGDAVPPALRDTL